MNVGGWVERQIADAVVAKVDQSGLGDMLLAPSDRAGRMSEGRAYWLMVICKAAKPPPVEKAP